MFEAITNVVVGFWVSVGAQILVFPWFGLDSTFESNLGIGLIFTVVSLARSYVLRRVFNKWGNR